VPSGNEDPVGAPACVSDPEQGRFCDGAGNCSNMDKPNGRPCTAGGQCASNFCIDGVCCNSACAMTCYQCNKAGAVGTCSVIAAGSQDPSATTPCDMSTQYCNGSGTCATNKKPNGQMCMAASECGSNNCVDGICCSGTCTSTCQACNVEGSKGSCVNLPAGSQDTMAATPCAGTSYCDAAGTCQSGLKPNGNVCTADNQCGSAHCADGVCCDKTCGEACYTCNLPGGVPGQCVGVPTGTKDVCPGADHCDANNRCTSGKKANGATCAVDSECASNACVDGNCCESGCGGKCRTCKNATGTCVFAAMGTDARMDCKGELNCGGSCDGQGGCTSAPQGKECRVAGCQADLGLITGAGMCDGAGNCSVTTTMNCSGFGCFSDATGAHCKTDCATDPDCAVRRYCQTGADGGTGSQCPAALPLGSACERNTQCLSGTCAKRPGQVMGICCNTACDKCGTCDSTGTCKPEARGTRDGTCQDSASDPEGNCGGECDGFFRCIYPAAGKSCGTCKTCNGVGLCNVKPDDDMACGSIECDSLDTSCVDYHDLTTQRCASLGSCKQPNTVATCTDSTPKCGGGGAGGGGAGGAAGGSTGRDGGTDAGGGGGGGGGCCQVSSGPTPDGLVALLGMAFAFVFRRRRR
jgi:MYXO-CTERM domain-containing protein